MVQNNALDEVTLQPPAIRGSKTMVHPPLSPAPSTPPPLVLTAVHSHGNVTPGSQLCTVADEQSIQLSEDSNSACTLTHAQQRNVRLCLGALEEGLSVAIRLEDVLQQVQLLSFKKGEHVLTRDGEAKGICIVDEGVLEVVSPGGETVLSRLLPGDFCGELSTVFGFSCTATVQPEHRQVDEQTKEVCVYV